jgi:hypothetical protein
MAAGKARHTRGEEGGRGILVGSDGWRALHHMGIPRTPEHREIPGLMDEQDGPYAHGKGVRRDRHHLLLLRRVHVAAQGHGVDERKPFHSFRIRHAAQHVVVVEEEGCGLKAHLASFLRVKRLPHPCSCHSSLSNK